MTVHQVEEYYIHITTKGFSFSNESIEKARQHLIDQGATFEVQDDCIVVDDFSDQGDAETMEQELIDILNS